MKYLLPLLLIALNAFAQDDQKCRLELVTTEEEQGVTTARGNKNFLKLLQDKGYEVSEGNFEEYYDISSDDADLGLIENANNKIYLYYDFFHCGDTNSALSSLVRSPKWKCPVGVNYLTLVTVSQDQVGQAVIKTRGGTKKTFKTELEAQNYLVKGFKEALPSCKDLRSKSPEVGSER